MNLQKQSGVSLIVIILIIVGVLVLAGGVWYWKVNITPSGSTICPADAKVCPDGTTVGRTGPNCEFAPCPEAKDETAGWQTYRNKEYGFEVKYPKSWYAYEDTRGSSIVISTFTKDKYDEYYGTFEHTKLGDNSGTIIIMRD